MGRPKLKLLQESIESVIKGKSEAVKMAIVTLLAKGHLLLEDVPGIGKTTLAFTLAKATNCSFQRIQFTSDMLPTDIIGVNIYNPDTKEFEFKSGPLFANIVLADEINRTNPKTQSALLEAMNERRVSVDRSTYRLPEPFMVIATQMTPLNIMELFPHRRCHRAVAGPGWKGGGSRNRAFGGRGLDPGLRLPAPERLTPPFRGLPRRARQGPRGVCRGAG